MKIIGLSLDETEGGVVATVKAFVSRREELEEGDIVRLFSQLEEAAGSGDNEPVSRDTKEEDDGTTSSEGGGQRRRRRRSAERGESEGASDSEGASGEDADADSGGEGGTGTRRSRRRRGGASDGDAVGGDDNSPRRRRTETRDTPDDSDAGTSSRRRRRVNESGSPREITTADLTAAASEAAARVTPAVVMAYLDKTFGVTDLSKLPEDRRAEFVDGVADLDD